MSNQSQQSEQGSFLTGLGLGLLGGAVGYFLFATDKGKDIRKKLSTEWQKAEKIGVSEVIDEVSSDHEILKQVKEFFSHILEQAKQEQSQEDDMKAKKKTKKKKQLFKGAA